MNRIVREHCPVAELPEDLREGLPDDGSVRVTIKTELLAASEHELLGKPSRVPTLKELLAMRRPPYKTTQQIVDEVRSMRDEWDG